MYVVLQQVRNSFSNQIMYDEEGKPEYDVYGILDKEDLVTLFELQRPHKSFVVRPYTEEFDTIDLGVYGYDIICDSIIVFHHEDTMIEDRVRTTLGEYELLTTQLLQLMKSMIHLTDNEYKVLVDGMISCRYKILDAVRSSDTNRTTAIVEEVLTEIGGYDDGWRNSQVWKRVIN